MGSPEHVGEKKYNEHEYTGGAGGKIIFKKYKINIKLVWNNLN